MAGAVLVQLSVWLLVLVLMCAALSCPRFIALLVGRHRGRRNDTHAATDHAHLAAPGLCDDEPSGELEVQVDAVYLDCLSTAELCRAWRQSFVWLQHATTDEHRARIAACRERYLTEMHRRDPAGFTTWLQHNPRAASGPERYLSENGS